MADYQSLLTRAVANLPSTSSAATRQAIYDRARKALLTQLRTLRPPLPESDIAREEKALNQAIALVEAKFGAIDGVGPEPTPAPTAPAASGAPDARPPAPSGAPARSHDSVAPTRPPLREPPVSKPVGPPTSAHSPVAPAPAEQPRPRTAPTLPSTPSTAQRESPAAPTRPAPALQGAPLAAKPTRPPQGLPPRAPALRADRQPPLPGEGGGVAAPAVAARPESPVSAPSNLAKVVPTVETSAGGSGAPPVVARIEDEAALGDAPEVPIDDERPGVAPRYELEGQRPHAPMAVSEKSKSWLWLALAVVLGAVLSVAGAAIVMRQKPQDLAIAPPEPQQEAAPQSPAKIAQRAQSTPTEDSSTPLATSGSPQPSQTPGQSAQEPANSAPDGGAGATLPSAARAAMLIASPDNPQKPVVNLGSTVWSTIPAAPGQPATVAVKADADIPDLKLHATMTLRKNTDPTLQATHTIDLKFAFADGAPLTGFKDVGAPQMRKLDSTASEALTSVKVKISDIYFLIALAKGDQDTARNLDLMQTRAWFDYPLLLNDNRIAKLVFQKSAEGEALLAKAFDAWK
jgi:hypothetical protein